MSEDDIVKRGRSLSEYLLDANLRDLDERGDEDGNLVTALCDEVERLRVENERMRELTNDRFEHRFECQWRLNKPPCTCPRGDVSHYRRGVRPAVHPSNLTTVLDVLESDNDELRGEVERLRAERESLREELHETEYDICGDGSGCWRWEPGSSASTKPE